MTACISTALIVSGGIAGLSAAVSLSRVGMRCEVVEFGDAPLGASLGLSGRAAKAVDELGLYEGSRETGQPFSRNSTAVKDLRRRHMPNSERVARPFDWILLGRDERQALQARTGPSPAV